MLRDDALQEGGGVDEHDGPPRPAELVGEVLRHRRPVRPVPRRADAVVGRGAGGVLHRQRPPHVAHRRRPQRRLLKPNTVTKRVVGASLPTSPACNGTDGDHLYLREHPGRVADEDGSDGAQRVERLLRWAPMDAVVLLPVRFPCNLENQNYSSNNTTNDFDPPQG